MLFVRNWPRCHHLYACDSYSLIVIEIGLRHQVLTQTIDSELLRLFVKCKNVKGTELVIIVSYSVNLSRIIVLVGLHAKITLPKTAFIWFDKKHFIVINVIITCKQIMFALRKQILLPFSLLTLKSFHIKFCGFFSGYKSCTFFSYRD